MKRVLLIILLAYTGSAFAQIPTLDERSKAADTVYALYKIYSEGANLRTIDRGMNDRKIVEFKLLFANDATIDDDITTSDTINWSISKPITRTVPQYLAAVRASFKTGINGSIDRASISFDSLAQKLVKIVYERNENAINSQGFRFSNIDTMVIRIKLSDDYSGAQIASVSSIGGQLRCQGCAPSAPSLDNDRKDKDIPAAVKNTATNEQTGSRSPKTKDIKAVNTEATSNQSSTESKNKVRCPDDDDCDGVLNLVDKCPEIPGLAKYGGCPAPDPIRVAMSLNVGGGAGVLSVGSNPSNNYFSNNQSTGFNSFSPALPSQVSYKTNPGGGYHVGLDIDLFFDKSKNIGFSLGADFMQNILSAEVNNFNVTYGVSGGGYMNNTNDISYTRILTGFNYSEKITQSNLSIPILFKYETAPNKPVGLDLEIGPVLSVLATAATSASADMNFEAAYSPGNITSQQTLQYAGNNPTGASNNLLLTQANFRSSGSAEGINAYFNSLYNEGYYVGLNQHESGNAGSVKYNFGFGGLLRIGGIYRATKTVSVLFGVYSLVNYNSHSESEYQPFSAYSDFKSIPGTFQSFLNGLGGSLSAQVGANIGLEIRFGTKTYLK